MNVTLTTESQLAADVLKLSEKRTAELRLKHQWPHVRLGRFDIRYTEAQVEQIVAMQTVVAKAAPSPTAKIPGQTARSASRKKAS